jgi:hypothetical protein
MSISLTDVFLLWHIHDLTDDLGTHKEVKLIGIFSSEAKASEAIELVKDKDGFRESPLNCFEIVEMKVDQPSWIDGFSTIHWTE